MPGIIGKDSDSTLIVKGVEGGRDRLMGAWQRCSTTAWAALPPLGWWQRGADDCLLVKLGQLKHVFSF
jgi:hypothetical protein